MLTVFVAVNSLVYPYHQSFMFALSPSIHSIDQILYYTFPSFSKYIIRAVDVSVDVFWKQQPFY